MPTPLSKTEVALLYLTFGLLVFGIVMSRLDAFYFEFTYVIEDGFIEWMTVLALLSMMGVSLFRLFRLLNRRSCLFIFILAGFILACLFVAGEEMSWGQRLLNRKSSTFFVQNNTQKETNFHNLVIAGESVNLLVFSRLLILAMASYLFVLPVLYERNLKVKSWILYGGIPIPKLYQIIAVLAVFTLISLCPSPKRAELLEFGACFMLLSIVLFPKNKEVFE